MRVLQLMFSSSSLFCATNSLPFIVYVITVSVPALAAFRGFTLQIYNMLLAVYTIVNPILLRQSAKMIR
jgi:hypothetical protein